MKVYTRRNPKHHVNCKLHHLTEITTKREQTPSLQKHARRANTKYQNSYKTEDLHSQSDSDKVQVTRKRSARSGYVALLDVWHGICICHPFSMMGAAHVSFSVPWTRHHPQKEVAKRFPTNPRIPLFQVKVISNMIPVP